MMNQIGSMQVTDGADYDRPGEWVIEQLGYHGDVEPSWSVPGWIEDRFGRSGFFPTYNEARDFIAFVTA